MDKAAADKAPETIAAANGIAVDPAFAAVAPPLYLTSTFALESFGHPQRYDYTRTANPSRELLADTLAKLENGAGGVVVSSGLAAVDVVLSFVTRGDCVVAPHDCYAGTRRLLNVRGEREQFDVVFVDQNDTDALRAALERRPRLVFVETPSNPLMRLTDISEVSALAHEAGAKVAVDNTLLSPALQQPIRLGADFVIHSTTKFLNGHSDIVGGAVIAADASDAKRLSDWANVIGVTGAPFDSYLTLRGIRTLFPRMRAQERTAAALATFLQDRKHVRAVHYPGLENHRGHTIAKAQQSGYGAMLSFELDGDADDVRKFVEALEIVTLAVSLGGVESLIAHPATMTHSSMSPDARRAAGISDNLLRLSVGLESEADLLQDFDRAFAALAGR